MAAIINSSFPKKGAREAIRRKHNLLSFNYVGNRVANTHTHTHSIDMQMALVVSPLDTVINA